LFENSALRDAEEKLREAVWRMERAETEKELDRQYDKAKAYLSLTKTLYLDEISEE